MSIMGETNTISYSSPSSEAFHASSEGIKFGRLKNALADELTIELKKSLSQVLFFEYGSGKRDEIINSPGGDRFVECFSRAMWKDCLKCC